MQHVSICNYLAVSLFLFCNLLYGQEKTHAMVLFESVESPAIKPPLKEINQNKSYVHDITLTNNKIIVRPKTFFCLAQLAMVKKSLNCTSVISFDYYLNSTDSDAMHIISNETFFDLDTGRHWQYYIFQVKDNKKGKFSITLTPNYHHLQEKIVEVIVP
jgi:hypothetical protein